MKRIAAVLALAALCLSLLAACGGGQGAQTPAPSGAPSQSQAPSQEPSQAPSENPSEAPSEEPSQAPVVVPTETPEETPAPSESAEAKNPSLTLSMSDAVITYAGYVLTLKPTFTDTDAAPLTWSSSDESVASVDAGGNVTSLAPGKTVITAATAGGLSAQCTVRCSWSEGVDLAAFAQDIFSRYEFSNSLALADDVLLDNFYAGLTAIDTKQCLVYIPQMSMNMGEVALVEVANSADAAKVQEILQARIDYMAGDGNGPGGAFYPSAMDCWENESRVVTSGNYVMMVVGEGCDDIVNEFKALF